jgi:hypothetical protein
MREIPDSHIFTAFLESQNNLQYGIYMREISNPHIFTAYEKMKNSKWTLLYENQLPYNSGTPFSNFPTISSEDEGSPSSSIIELCKKPFNKSGVQ